MNNGAYSVQQMLVEEEHLIKPQKGQLQRVAVIVRIVVYLNVIR